MEDAREPAILLESELDIQEMRHIFPTRTQESSHSVHTLYRLRATWIPPHKQTRSTKAAVFP